MLRICCVTIEIMKFSKICNNQRYFSTFPECLKIMRKKSVDFGGRRLEEIHLSRSKHVPLTMFLLINCDRLQPTLSNVQKFFRFDGRHCFRSNLKNSTVAVCVFEFAYCKKQSGSSSTSTAIT